VTTSASATFCGAMRSNPMTPKAITAQLAALKQEIDEAVEAANLGNLLRAERLLQETQRRNVALLRLVEIQLSGAAGRPRFMTSRRAAGHLTADD